MEVDVYFVVAADNRFGFADSPEVRADLGAFLHQMNDPRLAESLVELYKTECATREFDLVVIPASVLEPHQLVLANRQVDRSKTIGANLNSEDYKTADPIFEAIGECAIRLASLEEELRQVFDTRPQDQQTVNALNRSNTSQIVLQSVPAVRRRKELADAFRAAYLKYGHDSFTALLASVEGDSPEDRSGTQVRDLGYGGFPTNPDDGEVYANMPYNYYIYSWHELATEIVECFFELSTEAGAWIPASAYRCIVEDIQLGSEEAGGERHEPSSPASAWCTCLLHLHHRLPYVCKGFNGLLKQPPAHIYVNDEARKAWGRCDYTFRSPFLASALALEYMDVGTIESSMSGGETSSSWNGLTKAGDGTSHELSRDLEPKAFSAGEIVFYSNRVEFCGADICSGVRSSSRRIVLELLSQKRNDGEFVAYSGAELESQLKNLGGQGTASGLIRDLRDDVTASLRSKAGIICGRKDVILSGGPGYRFAESVTVQFADPPTIKDITDIDESEDVPNVPDNDVLDAFDVPDNAAARREWILQQLAEGVELKAPLVADQFKCSVKTAQRDLTLLKEEGKIEYVGAPRTGYYQLCQTQKTDQ